jgi:hypothetical protein
MGVLIVRSVSKLYGLKGVEFVDDEAYDVNSGCPSPSHHRTTQLQHVYLHLRTTGHIYLYPTPPKGTRPPLLLSFPIHPSPPSTLPNNLKKRHMMTRRGHSSTHSICLWSNSTSLQTSHLPAMPLKSGFVLSSHLSENMSLSVLFHTFSPP